MANIILGSGPSLFLYEYNKDDIIYCPLSMKCESFDQPNITYFEMHKEMEPSDLIISQNNYPLEEIIKQYNSTYFTNTISYIIAYCLYKGMEEIEIHGVDLLDINDSTEYIFQRGSVCYWLGRCQGSGIKIHMPNKLLEPTFLYGYEDKKKQNLINKLNCLNTHARKQLHLAVNEISKNQYLGFMAALDMIKGEL